MPNKRSDGKVNADYCRTCGAKRKWMKGEREIHLDPNFLLHSATYLCAKCWQKQKKERDGKSDA